MEVVLYECILIIPLSQVIKPHDLLCAGFASCLNITTRIVLKRKNIKDEKVIFLVAYIILRHMNFYFFMCLN